MSLHRLLHRLRGHAHGAHTDQRVFVGRKAASYDRASGWLMRPLYRAVAGGVVDDLPPDGRLLDIGTGPGRLLLEIARRRPDAQLVGIDPSADMVARAETHARAAGIADRVTARVATAEDLRWPDGSFDVVVSSLSAHHWADVDCGIVEQARVMRPGGHLYVCDLRHSATALERALTTTFEAADVSRLRLRGVAGLVLICHRAVRSTPPAR